MLVPAFFVQGQSPANANPPVVQPKVSPDTVVLTIGNLKITAKEVDDYVEALPPQYRAFFAGRGKPQVADLILRNKLLSQEAAKRGLDKKSDVQLSLRIARESILVAALENQVKKENPVTEETAAQYLRSNQRIFEEAHVKRILIASRSSVPISTARELPSKEEALAKAEDIRKKLLEGADFAEMAAKYSCDMMTSGQGGDLGFIRRIDLQNIQAPKPGQVPIVPEVEEVIFSTPAGSLSNVIDAPFGFEIIKVEERRIPKLEGVQKEITTRIYNEKMGALLKGLREKAQVKIETGYFSH
jgi:parvulin-like peptidyl-prolyl isomerase